MSLTVGSGGFVIVRDGSRSADGLGKVPEGNFLGLKIFYISIYIYYDKGKTLMYYSRFFPLKYTLHTFKDCTHIYCYLVTKSEYKQEDVHTFTLAYECFFYNNILN